MTRERKSATPMKILTKEETRDLLKEKALDTFITQLSDQLWLVKGAYAAPVASGKQIALSRLFAYLVLSDSPVCVYITAWSIAPMAELLDLFYGYRRSVGEMRPLMEAPVHLFEPTEEEPLVSVLSVVFFFPWDAWVFDLKGKWLLRKSHDGWFEIRAADDEAVTNVATELESYGIPLLARETGR